MSYLTKNIIIFLVAVCIGALTLYGLTIIQEIYSRETASIVVWCLFGGYIVVAAIVLTKTWFDEKKLEAKGDQMNDSQQGFTTFLVFLGLIFGFILGMIAMNAFNQGELKHFDGITRHKVRALNKCETELTEFWELGDTPLSGDIVELIGTEYRYQGEDNQEVMIEYYKIVNLEEE